MITRTLGTTALVVQLAAASPGAQQPLDAVQQMYAAADYEGALHALDSLSETQTPALAIERHQLQALCLIALGRQDEAASVIDRIITTDPAFEPGEHIPPRVRSVFDAAQRRILPRIARDLYAEGKAAYDRQAHAEAVEAFEQALALLEGLPEADRAGLTDLRMLGEGFIGLSRAALARAAEAAATPEPVAAPPADDTPPSPPTEAMPIRQDMPPWKPIAGIGRFPLGFDGVIEVDIDESGAVTAARIVDPSYPAYDTLLLEAARAWRYVPAQRNGEPIKSTRRVGVKLETR